MNDRHLSTAVINTLQQSTTHNYYQRTENSGQMTEIGIWPPASPSCRLALRAGSHRGGAYAPAGSGNAECGMRNVKCGMWKF
jgi:hypothetical protein